MEPDTFNNLLLLHLLIVFVPKVSFLFYNTLSESSSAPGWGWCGNLERVTGGGGGGERRGIVEL